MSDLSSYFDSYARRSPLWSPGLAPKWKDSPFLVPVNEKYHPKLFSALNEECEFRGVEVPACYVDVSGRTYLGNAIAENYSIWIEAAACRVFTSRELRALAAHEIKHLYQGRPGNNREVRLNEYDSDRAAVSSTDYETIRSYVHKAVTMQIKRKVPDFLQPLAFRFHEAFPNVVAENFWFRHGSSHPSPAARIKAMREYAEALTIS